MSCTYMDRCRCAVVGKLCAMRWWLFVVSPCLIMQPLFASIKYNLNSYLTLVAIATNFFCFVGELHVL